MCVGDTHIGSKSFTKKSKLLLLENLNWVKERQNARIVIMGDVFEMATLSSPSSPFDQNGDQFQEALEILEPYKEQIITGIIGNHSNRLVKFADINIMQILCLQLGIPYGGYSCGINFKIGKRTDDKSNRFLQTYKMYAHHGIGGGSSVGGKLNKTTKLKEIVSDADIFCNGHSHQIAAVPVNAYKFSPQSKSMKQYRVWYLNTGSYLDYEDSYAEATALSPGKLGSPIIRLDSKIHDINITL